jgi:hypothetical protein
MTGLGANIVADDPDVRTAHPARIYDCLLGGKNNFAADRDAAERLLALVPYCREAAWANRQFMTRAVCAMSRAGIDQFLDLGSGFPTSPNVHEVARRSQPAARVVYVDNDPVVTQHNAALLGQERQVVAVAADVRCPTCILDRAEVHEVIDFSRPVGLLFFAVLHFVTDDEQPGDIVATFRSRVPSGSMVAISHMRSDCTPPEIRRTVEDTYGRLDPGLVPVSRWQPELTTIRASSPLDLAGGVGQVL